MAYLKSSLALCGLLFLVSPNKRNVPFKVYAVFMFILMLSSMVYSTYGKVVDCSREGKFLVLRAAEMPKYFFGMIACSVATIQLIFVYPDRVNHILESLDSFDKVFPGFHNNMKAYYWIGFAFSNITTLSFLVLKRIYWLRNPSYRYYYDEDFLFFRLDAAMFLYFWLALEICRRFGVLNKSMKAVAASFQQRKVLFGVCTVKISPIRLSTMRQVQEISKYQNYLNHILCDLNKSFGFFILFYILFASFFIIEGILIITWYTVLTQTSSAWLEVTSLRWIYCYAIPEILMRIVAIASVGTYLMREAGDITSCCYNIIHSLEHDRTYEAQLLKDELRHLTNQMIHQKPYLSAAGFFVIDFTMIGSISCTVTSYIIVALQFLKDG